MDEQIIGLVLVGMFAVFFVWIGALFVKKSKARKQAMFGEAPVSLQERGDETPVERSGEGLRGTEEAAFAEQVDPKERAAEPGVLADEPGVIESEVVVPEPLFEPDELVESKPDVESDSELESEPVVEPDAVVESAPSLVAVDEPLEPAAASADDLVLQVGLRKTSASFMGRLSQLFGRHDSIDESLLDELEEILLTADLGVRLTMEFIDELRDQLGARKLGDAADVKQALQTLLRTALESGAGQVDPFARAHKPKVILFVGVNGVGKTTTIGKIAAKLTGTGAQVVLGAGDTFRAAAVEQLKIWGERAGCRIIAGEPDADPASVLYNTVKHGADVGADFVLADTAGRLHTKADLMDELKKVKRAVGKAVDGAPHEVWLVVDATTGQNALLQAKQFHEAVGLTGLILTKLDGTAKGGVVVGITEAVRIPVYFVGVGEKADDLRPFDADAFLQAIFQDWAA